MDGSVNWAALVAYERRQGLVRLLGILLATQRGLDAKAMLRAGVSPVAVARASRSTTDSISLRW